MEKKWWHGKTAYQIYPKSFYDTNGDGIGDLKGIIEKLDYLKELGIEILWISPVYLSPFADQGYDIADYCAIDPIFGTMEDMDRLISEAKARGIDILMDLVVNHCSDEHPWFVEACRNPEGPYGQYFYLQKVEDGKLPCNWRSYFGGPVWERIGQTDWYYLHLFHKKQPDLNWENPKLRQEIYRMMNWWLDKGIAGFRIDAIINIKKPLPFRDYPADREDGLCDMGTVLEDAKGIMEFLDEMRDQTFSPHDAFSVGEVFNDRKEELPDYIGDEGCFSSIFDFSQTVEGKSPLGWYACKRPGPDAYKRCCFESQRRAQGVGLFSNIIENHDEPRGVSYYLPDYARNVKGKKLLAAVYFMLKGLPFLYQGQEIGMENMEFSSIEELDDVSSRFEYQVCLDAGLDEREAMKVISQYSRGNSRTPFQWDDSANGGFTTGKPWLLVNPNYREINAASQERDPDSLLSFYKQLIRLRKDPQWKDTVIYGETLPVLEEMSGLMAYLRRGEKQEILVLGNFNSQEITVPLKRLEKEGISGEALKEAVREGRILLNNCETLSLEGESLRLQPLQAAVIGIMHKND